LIEWNEVGPRFSHGIQQALSTLLKASPPNENRLLILATTSSPSTLRRLGMMPVFKKVIPVPAVTDLRELEAVLEGSRAFEPQGDQETAVADPRALRKRALRNVEAKTGPVVRVGIKTILETVDSATYGRSQEDQAMQFADELAPHVEEMRMDMDLNGGQMQEI
jgi:vesicle-fusing ATPase